MIVKSSVTFLPTFRTSLCGNMPLLILFCCEMTTFLPFLITSISIDLFDLESMNLISLLFLLHGAHLDPWALKDLVQSFLCLFHCSTLIFVFTFLHQTSGRLKSLRSKISLGWLSCEGSKPQISFRDICL